jgi:hypothetical protein
MSTNASDPRRGDAMLWASAAVIAGLLILQAGRPPVPPGPGPDPAMSSAMGGDGFAVVAGRSGRGDDADPTEIVWVLDSRAEALMVYEIEDARRGDIIFRQGADLRVLFQSARR